MKAVEFLEESAGPMREQWGGVSRRNGGAYEGVVGLLEATAGPLWGLLDF
jgi:hypothetical protein